MNTATNIIYKAKDFAGQWATGWYYPDGSTHIIKTAKRETIEINPETLCIGCVIEAREFFNGDAVVWPEYGIKGIVRFGLDGFNVEFGSGHTKTLHALLRCSRYITITGNIHD
jgi:hypothetical protein